MKIYLPYFKNSFLVTFLGLLLGAGVGYYYNPTTAGALSGLFIVFILCVLEVSISFDNAVVNATVLKNMTPLWQHRFLTWGILIAVFGMRLVFPLLIVAIVAGLNPWQALTMAALHPQEYAQIMLSVHHEVSAFGGSFLMLVAMKYFFDHTKDNHWIQMIERPLVKLGRLEAVEVGLTLLMLLFFAKQAPEQETLPILVSGIVGILCFLGVEGIGEFLKTPENDGATDLHKASVGMFLYLEVLDASFSFDGVIGAFAITNNLFIIAIGLGVGAMFVRSLTIMMVDKGTLNSFEYLEHGAFYAVAALAAIMLLGTLVHIPEWFTGLIGATFIGLSIYSSIKKRKLRV